ncbi:MAG: hypothetical protein V3U11_10565 [Planctomycetota bacterium]
MGHSNRNAPDISQTVRLGDKASLKLSYTSITWASGTWAKALTDKSKREKMRSRINSAATQAPLGAFATDKPLSIAGKKVPAGSYKLAFMLDDKYRWQLVFTGENKITWPLDFEKGRKNRKRLVLNLTAGDENFTAALQVAFGAKECEIPITLPAETPKKLATINAKCPLMDEPVDPKFAVTYKGFKIGFCCEDCLPDWKELPAKEKDEALAAMRKK